MLKYKLLSKKPNKNKLLFIAIILTTIIISISMFKVKTFDTEKVTGLINCQDTCQISLTLPYDKINIITNDSYISYNNEIYSIKNITYNEPYLNGEIAYEDIVFDTNLITDKSLINFTILSNRQKIFTKIKNIILER